MEKHSSDIYRIFNPQFAHVTLHDLMLRFARRPGSEGTISLFEIRTSEAEYRILPL